MTQPARRVLVSAWLTTMSLVAMNDWACSPLQNDTGQGASAEFGVLFGGQLQRRRELPFELDATRLQPGFRVTFPAPLATSAALSWELSKPGPSNRELGLSDPGERRTELGATQLPAGSRRFDQPLQLLPGDNVGLWNLRVVLGSEVILDRPFVVYDPRRRKLRQATRRDGGA